jgi:polar amino acid transport system substrate-binding protein
VIALSREAVGGLVDALPGSRVLDGGFLNSTTAVAVAKNKPAALAAVTAFIEEAKGSGFIRRALDSMGLKTSQVAPVGMKA